MPMSTFIWKHLQDLLVSEKKQITEKWRGNDPTYVKNKNKTRVTYVEAQKEKDTPTVNSSQQSGELGLTLSVLHSYASLEPCTANKNVNIILKMWLHGVIVKQTYTCVRKKKDNLTGTLKNKSWNKGIREKETSKNDAKKWKVVPSE